MTSIPTDTEFMNDSKWTLELDTPWLRTEQEGGNTGSSWRKRETQAVTFK